MGKFIVFSMLLLLKSLHVMAVGEMYVTGSADYKEQGDAFDLVVHGNMLSVDDRHVRHMFNIYPKMLLETMQHPGWINATIIQTKNEDLKLIINGAAPNCQIVDGGTLHCTTKEDLGEQESTVRFFNLSFGGEDQ